MVVLEKLQFSSEKTFVRIFNGLEYVKCKNVVKSHNV